MLRARHEVWSHVFGAKEIEAEKLGYRVTESIRKSPFRYWTQSIRGRTVV
jgi:hypothetical protein